MAVERPIYQLSLDLDLPVEEGAADELNDRQRELTARLAFEGNAERKAPEWFGEYENLVRGGWPFRVAVYVAWAACPKGKRLPKTLGELAGILGLNSPRAIHMWRGRNRAIDEMVAMLQAAPLFEHRADVMAALVEMAQKPDYKAFNDRKLFLELTGDYVRRGEVRVGRAKDLSEMSEAELLAWLGDENASSPAAPRNDMGIASSQAPRNDMGIASSQAPRNDMDEEGEG